MGRLPLHEPKIRYSARASAIPLLLLPRRGDARVARRRQRPEGALQIWVGVDDEYYGGLMRPLPAIASP